MDKYAFLVPVNGLKDINFFHFIQKNSNIGKNFLIHINFNRIYKKNHHPYHGNCYSIPED